MTTRVAVLAQDLIWQDRLARAVEAAGAAPTRAKTAPELDRALECADYAIVDLTARAYDPLAAIERAVAHGARVLAVGQHDDVDQRKRALARGADKVLAYRKLYEDGPATVAAWLALPAPRRVSVATRPVVPAERYATRLARAAEVAAEAGVAALLIGVGSDLRYLTGYEAMPLERLTLLVIRPGRAPSIVVPRLERGAAEAGLRTSIDIRTWDETDDPYALAVDGLVGAARVAVSDTMLAMHVLRLQAALGPATTTELAAPVLRELRMVKDADEIAFLRLAAEAADRVVAQIAAGRLVGRTEADVAAEVRERLIAEGHEEAHFAIVGSGPNSASPHHEASERVIRAGEPIVLDIGGTLSGYGSDITRTLWVTGGDPTLGPDERFRHLFNVLYTAQAAGTEAVAPGVACEAIDQAARAPIEAEGYGDAFFHRTGHGIGLEGHEDPYLVAGNDLPLGPGWRSASSPGSTCPASTGRASRTSWCAARTARSCSTRRRASCTSSTADRRPAGRRRRLRYHRPTPRVPRGPLIHGRRMPSQPRRSPVATPRR